MFVRGFGCPKSVARANQISQRVIHALHAERSIEVGSSLFVYFYLKKLHKPGFTVGLLHSYEKPDIVIRGPVGVGILNVHDIEKKFLTAWDNVDKTMTKYKKICEEFVVESVKEFSEHGKTPGEAICAVAEKENAAFVVVGSRGQSTLRRTFLGSVSDYVLNHCKRAPVLVVPLAPS